MTTFDERYELGDLLGRGGMAEVFRARDHALGRAVAVKVLSGDRRDGDTTDVRRLRDEARAAAGIDHPHVVAVHDVGTSSLGVFVVMELVEGRSWREELRERGPQPEHEVARVGAQVASGLAAAHARGVLHRDVNPGNVMLGADGAAKLTDFGIARIEGAGGLTETGKVVGTPTYMAPEQVRGGDLDGACDVYSLGCALYEAATGRLPFTGRGSAETASARLREPPLPPRQVRPELSVTLEDLVMRAMALEPRARPDAATLSRDLHALVEGRSARSDDRPTVVVDADPGPTGRPDRAPEHTTPFTTGDTAPDLSPHAPSPGSGLRRAGTVLIALGVVALVALVLALLLL